MTILLYHSINQKVDDPLCQVSPGTLRRQLETLLEEGATFCPLGAAISLEERRISSRGTFSLTFDDGYEDFVEHALPILDDLGLSATQFICPAHIGEDNRWNYRAGFRARHMDLPTLRDLVRRSVTVQPHGWSHRSFLQLDSEELSSRLKRCCAFFREQLSIEPEILAYPYGTVRREQIGIVANQDEAKDDQPFEIDYASKHYISRLFGITF